MEAPINDVLRESFSIAKFIVELASDVFREAMTDGIDAAPWPDLPSMTLLLASTALWTLCMFQSCCQSR